MWPTAPGSPSCWSAGSCGGASYHHRRSGSSGTSHGTGRPSSRTGPEANRLHKVLQDASITLATVATDILGVSGRAMLTALVTGTTDPAVLADLARGKLRAKLPALRPALTGASAGTTPSL